ncbi:MAG: hypothetical protein QN183_01055 [Armatimonadota bacterium]|nr:hypothetical protein [Armatimonadota bacterium]MDR7534938.1 hypothetical protein [Armatimonadota bacterium]
MSHPAQRQGFLDQDVPAPLHRRNRLDGVQLLGCGQHHRVELGLRHESLEAVELAQRGVWPGGGAGPDGGRPRGGRRLQRLPVRYRIRIADGDQRDVGRIGQDRGVQPAEVAGADEAGPDRRPHRAHQPRRRGSR